MSYAQDSVNHWGQTLNDAANTPAGKAVGGMYAPIYTTAHSIVKGKNPLKNSPFGGLFGVKSSSEEAAERAMNEAGMGMPTAPSMVDSQGNLLPQYAMNSGNYNTGDRYLNKLGDRATAVGPSAWAQMQNKGIDMETAGLRDQAGRDASVALGTGMSSLASSGGLDGGARERMATSAGAQRMQAGQMASRQGSMAKNATGIEDERQKLGILQNLPGMYQNQAAFNANIDNKNIQNAIGSQLFTYGEKMKGYTGDKMAAATMGAGGKK